MKKIICGKLYDTTTAKEIGSWANAGSWRDFNHVEETLYKKRTGEYFLFGEGGANTKYSRRVDSNSWTGGEQIIPLTYKDAVKWAEENMDADDYQAEFGEVSEDGDDVNISFVISTAHAKKLEQYASQHGISKKALFVEMIEKL